MRPESAYQQYWHLLPGMESIQVWNNACWNWTVSFVACAVVLQVIFNFCVFFTFSWLCRVIRISKPIKGHVLNHCRMPQGFVCDSYRCRGWGDMCLCMWLHVA